MMMAGAAAAARRGAWRSLLYRTRLSVRRLTRRPQSTSSCSKTMSRRPRPPYSRRRCDTITNSHPTRRRRHRRATSSTIAFSISSSTLSAGACSPLYYRSPSPTRHCSARLLGRAFKRARWRRAYASRSAMRHRPTCARGASTSSPPSIYSSRASTSSLRTTCQEGHGPH